MAMFGTIQVSDDALPPLDAMWSEAASRGLNITRADVVALLDAAQLWSSVPWAGPVVTKNVRGRPDGLWPSSPVTRDNGGSAR